MQIVLYQNNAERERVDKSGYLTELFSLSGTLKDDADVTSPIIVIDLASVAPEIVSSDDNSEILSSDDDAEIVTTDTNTIPTFNYAYIPEFKRYYFVSSLEVLKGNNARHLYRMGLVCDLLMTYQSEIKSEHCLIARNEFNFDVMMNDPDFIFESKKVVQEFAPPAGALVNVAFNSFGVAKPDNIVLNVVTNIPAVSDAIYPPTGSGLPTIRPILYGAYGSSRPLAINTDDFFITAYRLMTSFSEKSSFVKSAIALPFIPSSYSKSAPVYLGEAIASNEILDLDNNPIYGRACRFTSEYLILADFTLPSPSSFYDLAPFAHYEIYIPFLGWRELDYQVVGGHRLIVYYSINYEDGSGDAYIYDLTDRRFVFSSSVQVGVKLAFSSTNAQALAEQRNASNNALALNLIGGLITGGASFASGNMVGVAMAGLNATKAITNYINDNAMRFERASSSFSGSTGALFAPLTVRLRVTTSKPAISDLNAYAHAYGRPLMQFMNLGDVSGRTIASDIHLLNFSGLDDERNNIISLLESGVIL